MKASQILIWHTILCALIWSIFPFEIRQLEVKSKGCEWFPFTESYHEASFDSKKVFEIQKNV